MTAIKRTAIILALGLAAGGCSVVEYRAVQREDLRNAQGHMVGFKDLVRDARTGEELAQLTLFVPRVGDRGEIVGYEERVRGGAVLRDLNGKRVGGRWIDARSLAYNPQNKGLTIVVHGRQSARATAVAAAPSIDELMHLARISN